MQIDRYGNADPTMEELEAALRRAKFEEDPADKAMHNRLLFRHGRDTMGRVYTERERRAFIAGYKIAGNRTLPIIWAGLMAGLLAIVTLATS